MYKTIPFNDNYEMNFEGDVRNKRTNHTLKYSSKGEVSIAGKTHTLTALRRVTFPFEWVKDLRDGETAKQVDNHPLYYITTHARVFSLKTYSWLTPALEKNQFYQTVQLDGRRDALHRLVGRHFLTDYEPGLWILHKDETLPIDEAHHLDNLWAGTPKDNVDDKMSKNRQSASVSLETKKAFQDFMEKYESMVWYARSYPPEVIHDMLPNTPEHIIQGAINAQARVEEKYPDEVDEYREHGDWQHGFNSGCLATMRMVLSALYPYQTEDDETGDPYWVGGIEEALEEFPELDT